MKIALAGSYLRVPQAAGQVKKLIYLVKNKFFTMYASILCDARQIKCHFLKYFKAWFNFNLDSFDPMTLTLLKNLINVVTTLGFPYM